jgi:predicted ferric reductase
MRTDIRGPVWFWFYRILIVLPLLVGAVFRGTSAGRGFLLSFAVACGYVGLAIVTLEFSLVARLKHVAGAFGQDALQQFHKQMGYVAVVFLLAHPVLLLICGYPMGILNPFSSASAGAWRWGVIGLYILLVLIGLSASHRRLHVPYEWWQLTHRLLAPLVLIMALVHILMVQGFTGSLPMQVLWITYASGFLSIAIYHRIYMPLRIWQRPWTVVRNAQELGDARTMVLKPVGHTGISFEPGQFAWLIMGNTPFHHEEHPISFSSSAEIAPGGEVSFTVKALGDWSSKIVPKVQPGTRVWVDGPYGVFSPDHEQGPGYVLIGGGIGITPLYSMCLTMADRQDIRPVLLFYAGRDCQELTFRSELDCLGHRMNLKVVYVLEHAAADWHRDTGRIDSDLLRRYLPKQSTRFQYFICGPPLLMDAMEQTLPALGIVPENIHTERFDLI